ncbi:MAG: imidazole glycerol phosphate synthase subunit HisH [Ginsengibacter sp.]
MKVAVIKYNAGNVQSVLFAMLRLGFDAEVTDDHEILRSADKVIFPGVGNAWSAMESLKSKGIDVLLPTLQQPVLGICVGMQLLCNSSEENNTKGLGIIDLPVKKFKAVEPGTKIPHMGWNQINHDHSALFEGVKQNAHVYFVHSYYAEKGKESTAITNYIDDFSAVVQRGNFYGVQFHTEKSSAVGDQILLNFLNLKI